MQKYEEKDQKLIGEAVIEEVLNKNNFKDFKTKLHNKNSKCCYRTNKTTTIKLNKKEAKEESAESLIVAAHEASHALNYREGITNAKLIKFTEISSRSILLFMLTASAILSFYNWQYSWLVLILLITSFFSITKFYFKYYIYDETKTEERALEEIRSVWGKLQTDIKFEEVEERNKARLEKTY
ncbi:zinc metallopeptidase [Lysinibacillus xylanilyticus]|uniref:zinc metallopeptidase n=1 Tax=Lysinibacillus xylanilyticus TaxID=582475 RepID=UPI002B253FC4|nr:zinc metallopeptidase [Lysinibacillus xylanilyticus]MEB2280171.1 zinc metallopeptidase [Lysinibacillus xylanilyticus]